MANTIKNSKVGKSYNIRHPTDQIKSVGCIASNPVSL